MGEKVVSIVVDEELWDRFSGLANDKALWRSRRDSASKALRDAVESSLRYFVDKIGPIPNDPSEKKVLAQRLGWEMNLLAERMTKIL